MYKANRPCRFGGRQFCVGEEIPAELIDESRAKTLEKYGTIVSVPETSTERPQTADRANTRPAAENGSQAVERSFNGKPAAARKPTAKKGGK